MCGSSRDGCPRCISLVTLPLVLWSGMIPSIVFDKERFPTLHTSINSLRAWFTNEGVAAREDDRGAVDKVK